MRHACGAFGETGTESEMLNKVTHLFDCIEMGQSYTFHKGEITFSNKFYDTNTVDVWRSYEANMNMSSVWWSCIYGQENHTAIEHESGAMGNPDKPGVVPAVAWWTVGKDALAVYEYPSAQRIDVHNVKNLGSYAYDNSIFDGWNPFHSPSHEQYDAEGNVWSVVAVQKQAGDATMQLKRIVTSLNPETGERKAVAEYPFADIDLSKCTEMGQRYPDAAGRIGNMHSLQITRDYVIMPETSNLHDPCTWVFNNESIPGWLEEYSFEPQVNSTIVIVNMKSGDVVARIPVPAMFITHMLGAYQEDDLSHLHFDVLQYDDATPYTKYTFTEEMLKDEEFFGKWTSVMRYTINTADWSLVARKDLITSNINRAFEFSTINTAYQGKFYKFAYMTKNPFKRHGSVVKLNVETGETIEAELPNGLFPTEPIFLAAPGSSSEDDGVVLMSGVDGKLAKGFLMIYNATTMEVILHATAPKLALFGLHSKFYMFDVGCEADDCTPVDSSTSTTKATTTETQSTTSLGNATYANTFMALIALLFGKLM